MNADCKRLIYLDISKDTISYIHKVFQSLLGFLLFNNTCYFVLYFFTLRFVKCYKTGIYRLNLQCIVSVGICNKPDYREVLKYNRWLLKCSMLHLCYLLIFSLCTLHTELQYLYSDVYSVGRLL